MIYDLAISEGAHDDITRNAAWWSEHHSYDQAIRWRDAIYEQLETLRKRLGGTGSASVLQFDGQSSHNDSCLE